MKKHMRMKDEEEKSKRVKQRSVGQSLLSMNRIDEFEEEYIFSSDEDDGHS